MSETDSDEDDGSKFDSLLAEQVNNRKQGRCHEGLCQCLRLSIN